MEETAKNGRKSNILCFISAQPGVHYHPVAQLYKPYAISLFFTVFMLSKEIDNNQKPRYYLNSAMVTPSSPSP
jgi:hypothetical protein